MEKKIIQNIKNFIMAFGRDFTFVGNQFRVEALGHTHIIDLLFFNRELASLVAIELKTGPFKSSYLGQLNIYLQVLDDFVRKPNENPSIGIVLCKSADKAYVEYAVRDYDKPMGVATFKTATEMPEKLRRALPDMEELKKTIVAIKTYILFEWYVIPSMQHPSALSLGCYFYLRNSYFCELDKTASKIFILT